MKNYESLYVWQKEKEKPLEDFSLDQAQQVHSCGDVDVLSDSVTEENSLHP